MIERKRVEITRNTRQVLVIRNFGQRAPAWCEECAAATRMLTPEEARLLAGISLRELFRQIETGAVHYSEAAEGRLLVCLASLTTVML